MTYTEMVHTYQSKHKEFYVDPTVDYIDPFCMFGPLYYVGDKRVCVHLIDTGEGLLLIDSGFPHTTHLLINSIYQLGFDPHNVRWILHTHGHFDHFGSSNQFRNLFGCELAISKTDAELLRNFPETSLLSWCSSVSPLAYPPPEFQIEIEDNDILTFGNINLRCVSIPGHTPGTMAYFFDLTDGKKNYRAGIFGGAGMGSVRRISLLHFYNSLKLQGAMISSIDKMRLEQVDIMLGNHPANNDTIGKRLHQLEHGGNPFIDPKAWGQFLDRTKETLLAMLEQEFAEFGE